MGISKLVGGTAALFLGGVLLLPEAASQPAEDGNDGVEVLARGPVHEAFAEPATTRPKPAPLVPKKPPEPIEEVPPDQKPEGANVLWLPGYWAYDDVSAEFLWVSGFWRNFPPGRQWVPGYWNELEDGWQWVAGFWTEANQTEVQFLPTPPPSVDAGPSAPPPAADNIYVPGCWVWRQARYWWRPGYYIAPVEGYVWTPACYRWSPSGYIFIDGFWDYALRYRGCLYAPVSVSAAAYERPNFTYTPQYVVYNSALIGALFVRPDRGCYYFGDYFDPGYERFGFTTWINYRVGRGAYDPLYSYYRWHYRDYNWDRDVRALYADRRSGAAPRPAANLVQQNTLVQNIQNTSNTTNVTNVKNVVKNVTMIAPVTKVDQSIIKFQPVTKQQQINEQKTIAQFRDVRKQRAQMDRPGKDKDDEPRTAKLELPMLPPAAKEGKQPIPGLKAPPQQPRQPKTEERPAPKVDREKPAVLPKEPQPVTKQDPKEPKDPKTDPKEPKTEPKTKTDPKIEPKQPKIDPKKETIPPPEPKTKKELTPPEPKIEPKQPKVEPKKELIPPPQPKVEPKKEPAPPQPKVEPKKEPIPPPQPKVEPKKEPTPPPQPKVEPKKEPAPPPQPKVEPKKEPIPPPQPKLPPQPKVEPKVAPPQPAPPPAPKAAPPPQPAPPPAPKAAPPPQPAPPPAPKAAPPPQPAPPPAPKAAPPPAPKAAPPPQPAPPPAAPQPKAPEPKGKGKDKD